MIAGLVVYLAVRTPKGEFREVRDGGEDRELARRLNKGILSRSETLTELRKHAKKSFPKRKLAIVIDDIGYDREVVAELLSINAPITFAVLPHCRFSLWSAERIHQSGREVLLHLPMEPHGYPGRDPGKGALLMTMDDRSLDRELRLDIQAVPHAKGVNNHMGSRFMEDEGKLKIVFGRLRAEDLFFLDSLTTGHSKALQAARDTHVQRLSRDAFIDNGGDQEATFRELTTAIGGAEAWTKKVLIGHPYPGTISALKRVIKRIPGEGIEIVPVSCLRD